ncbi:type VI secretion system baseplate subunit TssF [Providencia rettgeri]|uniref:type VI secretion system baseplate subunit TssF n=1 Tax=Providencia rettgeri TaxID=587 RepID=UPI0014191EE6|nr:type VI secretion system baseplate subunit TssF [Providencia rettgeri]ELR5281239.1 type VI secretion system baseplate subunit TssF [Providencia rettgeri]NIA74560.1 type VI secretion system baseplate subunit TssF [Providencia rettgeri]NIA78107.1 type VI secretion system baseplate subunit TssF [Providencia rettgeri]NIB01387.1 type VI secretion system baseplate subunit TssF [Providencia rettgeri]NIB05474.1 type VI secretion system baseplate subunit TssF [Providencia rettgeri]
MDDLTLRYYDAEMRYLREAAKEFAQAHPDRAALLDLDKAGIPDPFVERLFEGFAFSMGQLRQKIDDDLPELTEGLVSLLWPHYLQTIPSLSVVELAPDIHDMKISSVIPANFEVLSRPIGPKKTVCRYRTTRDLTLNPIVLSTVNLTTEPDGRSVIRLQFDCAKLADWKQISLNALSFYLAGDVPTTYALHLALTKQVAATYIRLPSSPDRIRLPLWFSPGGFAEEDQLWPKGDSTFSGYQLLLEYFSFREKFFFVNLNGLDEIQLPEGLSHFELEIVLDTLWDSDIPLSTDNLKLHSVPVINLFNIEADPLTVNGLESEYLLRPRRLQDGHTEIYAVDTVHGTRRDEQIHYVPFSSFRHRGGMLRHNAPEHYYHTRIKRGVSGLHDTWLILGGEHEQPTASLESETLSLQLTGTNGQLPRKALQSTLLDRTEETLQTQLRVRNLCKPTLPCYPPAEDRFHWRVLSHLGASFLNMMDNVEVLRGTLALYDWREDDLNSRKLDAMIHVEQHLIERFEKGFLQRGIAIDITLDSHSFNGEGDIHLFGEMLNRFFALYTDVHLFNQLTLHILPTGNSLTWTENHPQ